MALEWVKIVDFMPHVIIVRGLILTTGWSAADGGSTEAPRPGSRGSESGGARSR